MEPELRLLSVHAHPDDEASKGAALVAMYHSEGVGSTLVCCTGGEEGDILNPAMDRPEIRDRLGAVRMEELAASVEAIGYDRLDLLGYRDSGMPETPANADPRNFANAPIDESTGRLVEIIRRDRPQVVITYSDDQTGYQHPDHLRVHDISILAWERAGSAEWYPDAGEPWTPLKLYYSVWSRARVLASHEKMLELGIESPFDDDWLNRPSADERITTHVDVGEHLEARTKALLAHATQVDPTSPFWFALSPEQSRDAYPYDDYILAESRVETSIPEDDLFAGIRLP